MPMIILKARDTTIKQIVQKSLKKLGSDADLNFIDVSAVTDFSWLFDNADGNFDFTGDISNWDVSSARTFKGMFHKSSFNGDLSKWKFPNATDLSQMFTEAKYNRDLSGWDVSGVKDFSMMFSGSEYSQDISSWSMDSATEIDKLFYAATVESAYKVIDDNGVKILYTKPVISTPKVNESAFGKMFESGGITKTLLNAFGKKSKPNSAAEQITSLFNSRKNKPQN